MKIADLIERHKKWGLNVLGFIRPARESNELNARGDALDEKKILCDIKNLPEFVHHNVVDEIIICLPGKNVDEIDYLLSFCEEEGIRSRLALEYYPMIIAKPTLEYFHGRPFLTFNMVPDKNFELLLKRVIDIVVSIIALILFSPLFLITALAIKLNSPGPVIFKQTRIGLAGRNFTIYKFRSMHIGAEKSVANLLPLNERDGPAFKIKDDPRVTSVGRIIRAFYIDELPQLVNVLKGDMSLVGPRPPLPSEVEKYEKWHRRRLSMKPGMTCFWQISEGKQKFTFPEWMRLDLKYIDEWNLTTDFKIMLKTIPKVFAGIKSLI
ncbi:MAG: sugar transferase [Candidatus Schekmanbacteria bacterium]|nr:MAG: sugar transferase [Candidatus Schekmanbacteria bacterium]